MLPRDSTPAGAVARDPQILRHSPDIHAVARIVAYRTISAMAARSDTPMTAAPFLPARLSLQSLRTASQECRGCDLYKHATQAVLGSGARSARIMMVGEQPGDQEDRQGQPFVGPAGRMLDRALDEVGIPREEVYVTNAVKHFKHTQRGKRRIHARPSAAEVRACRPWLEAEIQIVRPSMIVALGATAAMSLFGPDFRVTKRRGVPFASPWAAWSMATVHPSSLLRAPDEAARRAAWSSFISDLGVLARRNAEHRVVSIVAKRGRRSA
jgi:DNA polymerase